MVVALSVDTRELCARTSGSHKTNSIPNSNHSAHRHPFPSSRHYLGRCRSISNSSSYFQTCSPPPPSLISSSPSSLISVPASPAQHPSRKEIPFIHLCDLVVPFPPSKLLRFTRMLAGLAELEADGSDNFSSSLANNPARGAFFLNFIFYGIFGKKLSKKRVTKLIVAFNGAAR